MEVDQTATVLETNLETTPPVEVATHAPEETEIETTETPETKWEPNFKYAIKDEKFDMDEWVKPLITSKEVEEKITDLYTKAHGLDHVKKDRTALKEEKESLTKQYADTHTELESMKQSLGIISDFVKNDKMGLFFEALQIPEEKVLKYAIERLKYREMPPEERMKVDQQTYQQRRMQEMEWENQQLSQQQKQALVQQRTYELDMTLSGQEVSHIAQEYDRRAGRQGAFKEQVIMVGNYYDSTFGQDLSVQDAVKLAVEKYSGILGSIERPQENLATTQTPNQTSGQMPEKKPVIPTLRGRGTSPVKKSPSSIDDLRRMRTEVLARESGING